jgi:hypothetical protein
MSEKAATVEFGVISDWDIESANDENYVQSSDSIEIDTQLNWPLVGWYFCVSPSNGAD